MEIIKTFNEIKYMSNTKFKFVIQRDNQNIELTIEEAEKLYLDLKKIFDHETILKYLEGVRSFPPKPEYVPPSIPQNPWNDPNLPYPPNIIYCNLNNTNNPS